MSDHGLWGEALDICAKHADEFDVDEIIFFDEMIVRVEKLKPNEFLIVNEVEERKIVRLLEKYVSVQAGAEVQGQYRLFD